MVYKMGKVNIVIEMGNGLKEYGKMVKEMEKED